MKFDLGYNGDRVPTPCVVLITLSYFACLKIVQVNLTSEVPKPVKAGSKLVFSYGVHWHPVDMQFEDRYVTIVCPGFSFWGTEQVASIPRLQLL